MEYLISEQRKSKLLKEFGQLHSALEKLDFWNTHLPVNYIQYHESDSDILTFFHDFKFEIPEREWLTFNEWIISNYSEFSSRPENLLNYYDCINQIDEELSKITDKRGYIRRKLCDIESSFVGGGTQTYGLFKNSQTIFEKKKNVKYLADYPVYHQYKEFNIEPDFRALKPYPYHTIQVANGLTLARVCKYLHEKLDSLPKEKSGIVETSLDQQLLMLHYMGVLQAVMEAKNATKQAAFLYQFARLDVQRTRQRFSSINDLIDLPKEAANRNKRSKLEKDLNFILRLFEEIENQKAIKKIKADLKKLKPVANSK